MSQHDKKKFQRDIKENRRFLPTVSEVKGWPIPNGIPERNIKAEVCQHFGVRVGFDESTGKPKWYAFPQTMKGKLTGWILYFIEWDDPDRKWFGIGKVTTSSDLTGMHDADGNKLIGKSKHRIYVVEGMFDYLSVYQVRYFLQKGDDGKFEPGKYPVNVVSLTLGTVNAEEQIINNHEELLQYKEFVTVFDGDENTVMQDKKGDIRGKEATNLVHGSYPEKSYYVPLGKDLDPNAYITGGKEMIKDLDQLLAFPKEYRSESMINAGSFDRAIFETVLPQGVMVPEFPLLSESMRGFRDHNLVVLAAPPKSGKTTSAMHIHKAFIDAGIPTSGAYFEGTTEEAIIRFVCLDAGIDYEAFCFGEKRLTEAQISSGMEKLANTNIFNIASKNITAKTIGSVIRKEAVSGKRLFVLDHASYLVEGEKQERKLIRDLMTELADIKKKYPICILVVCHITFDKAKEAQLKRMHTSKDSRTWDLPFWYRISSHDARGGSAYAQWADAFLCIDKEYLPNEGQGRTQLKIAEARLVKRKGKKDILVLDQGTGRLMADPEEPY